MTDDFETLGGAGGRRLRHIAHLSGPAMDGDFLRAGVTLRESLDRLTCRPAACRDAGHAGASAATACSCLIQAVLAASSLAARVA